MSEYRKIFEEYHDEQLLNQYFYHKEDFTTEALVDLREEIEHRNFSQEKLDSYLNPQEDTAQEKNIQLRSEDFVLFDHLFSHTDILLAHAILRDSTIPFFIDNPKSTDTIPLESESERLYTIHVHKEFVEKAHAALDEHFEKNDGRYLLKHSSAKDRLRAFSFSDLHMNEFQAAEKVEVSFSSGEKSAIKKLAQRLIQEVDTIEEQQERVLFYYDTLEQVIDAIDKNGNLFLSRTELICILEVLQVYCDDPDFPQESDTMIDALLGFFIE